MKIKKFFHHYFSLLFLATLLTLGLYGCGGASPGVSIPAPVSQLLRPANPSGADASTVDLSLSLLQVQTSDVVLTGGPTSVLPGAQVIATSPLGSFTTTAGDDGSFRMTVAGLEIGDSFSVRQVVAGESSPETTLTVEGNIVGIGPRMNGFYTDLASGIFYTTGAEDNNGQVFTLNIISDNPILSFPESKVSFSGIAEIGNISANTGGDLGMVIADDQVLTFNLSTNEAGTPVNLTSGSALDTFTQDNILVSTRNAPGNDFIQFYNIQSGGLNTGGQACSTGVSHPDDPTAVHVRSPFIKQAFDDNSFNNSVVLSEFRTATGASLWALSRILFDGCLPGEQTLVLPQVVLPSSLDPKALVIFQNTNRALISDANNNQLHIADLNTGVLTASLEVGTSPHGVAVIEEVNKTTAYVVNQNENSISIINLDDLASPFVEGTISEVGLSPTDIQVVSNTGFSTGSTQLVVNSTFDNTAVIVNVGE